MGKKPIYTIILIFTFLSFYVSAYTSSVFAEVGYECVPKNPGASCTDINYTVNCENYYPNVYYCCRQVIACTNPQPPPSPSSSPDSSPGDGNPDDVLIDLGKVIDNVLVPLKFRFSSTSTLGEIIGALIPYLYAIAGIALLLFLIGGGYGYLTSAGDPKKIEAAKNTITLAIIGFLIIIAAYWATQIANYIFSLGSPIR